MGEIDIVISARGIQSRGVHCSLKQIQELRKVDCGEEFKAAVEWKLAGWVSDHWRN